MHIVKNSFPGRFPQQPLLTPEMNPDIPVSHAVVFIGGFCDFLVGLMNRLYRETPALAGREVRAYYHWDGGAWGLLQDRCDLILSDVTQWAKAHPGCPIVFIGHSYGGSAAMFVAQNLPVGVCPVAVLTLDPVSRRQTSDRSEVVDFWGNSWQDGGGGLRDVIPRIGGRWGMCPEADVNVSLQGKRSIFQKGMTHDRLDLFLNASTEHGESLLQLGERWLHQQLAKSK